RAEAAAKAAREAEDKARAEAAAKAAREAEDKARAEAAAKAAREAEENAIRDAEAKRAREQRTPSFPDEPIPQVIANNAVAESSPSITMTDAVTPMTTSQDTPARDATDADQTPTPSEPEAARPAARATARAARLLAEDEADQRVMDQRRRAFGRGDDGGTDKPVSDDAGEISPAAAAAQKAHRTSHPVRNFILYVIAVLIVAAGLVAAAPYWAPYVRTAIETIAPGAMTPEPSGPDPQVVAFQNKASQLEQAVATLANRVGTLESAPRGADNAAVSALSTRIAALETRPAAEADTAENSAATNQALIGQASQLTALTARVATLEAALGNAVRLEELAGRLTALEGKAADANNVLSLAERVAALERGDRDAAADRTRAAALVLAAAQLRAAVDGGRPYTVELETVKTLAARAGTAFDPAGFDGFASSGLATFDALRGSWPEIAAAAVRAAVNPATEEGWLRRSIDRALSIATLRPVGDTAGDSAAAIAARVEKRLAEQNLPAAVGEADKLTGPAADAARDWIASARARLTADQRLAELNTRTASALATAGGE
ncbi:MAG: hypothetical protein KDE14_09730, partial [Rhodobacteraceae bacterium]|nr:hypothetical protein [Paracoccaceae bacterium]